MKIAITAESTIDLPKDLLEKYDIKTIPFRVLLGENEFLDGELDTLEIFKFVDEKKILPKTSAVNEEQYKEFFENVLKDYDAIIHVSLSSKISSTCSNAQNVASKMDNVFVVDSLSLSTGIALLAIYARKLANNGLKPQEIFEKVTKRTADVQASFVVKKLNYLYKGGRCSALKFISASLLMIRPEIVLTDGAMGVNKKYMGTINKVVGKYCADCLKENPDADLDIAFVTYSSATDDMIETAKKSLIEKGFKNIYCTRAGATICSHCGENTLGILYLRNSEKES